MLDLFLGSLNVRKENGRGLSGRSSPKASPSHTGCLTPGSFSSALCDEARPACTESRRNWEDKRRDKSSNSLDQDRAHSLSHCTCKVQSTCPHKSNSSSHHCVPCTWCHTLEHCNCPSFSRHGHVWLSNDPGKVVPEASEKNGKKKVSSSRIFPNNPWLSGV